VAYKYFYESLCDTYIENSKGASCVLKDPGFLVPILTHFVAIFEGEGTEEEKENARQTLYTAIEGGIKIIHPL
jgi:valyl-tRNA synthetase